MEPASLSVGFAVPAPRHLPRRNCSKASLLSGALALAGWSSPSSSPEGTPLGSPCSSRRDQQQPGSPPPVELDSDLSAMDTTPPVMINYDRRARARLDQAERLDKLQDQRMEVLNHVQAYLVANHATAVNF